MASKEFTSPGEHDWTVPTALTEVTLKLWGAGGGDGASAIEGNPGYGASGGYVERTLSVTPGETLQVYVGGAGSDGVTSTSSTAHGGFNGGGDGGTPDGDFNSDGQGFGGAGGGGASDVRQGGSSLGDRIAVAAGGGGGGAYDEYAEETPSSGGDGGQGGASDGEGGDRELSTSFEGHGGGGGGTSSGGAGGSEDTSTHADAAATSGGSGSLGVGGVGGDVRRNPSSGGGGGGGGGGRYGGGGGGGAALTSSDTDGDTAGGGGGGGSNYEPTGSGVSTRGGGNSGNGKVVIEYPTNAGSFTVDAVTSSSVSLSWTQASWDDSSPDEYVLYRDTSPGVTTSDSLVHTTADGTVTSFSDTGLGSETTYYYAIRAVYNGGSDSSPMGETSAATQRSGPTNLTTTAHTTTSIELSWDPPNTDPGDSVDEYVVYRDTAPGGALTSDYTEIDRVPVGTTTYTDTGLAEGEAYHYRVTAILEVDQ